MGFLRGIELTKSPHYYAKKDRITVCMFDCYLKNSFVETSIAEHRPALRYDDSIDGTELDHVLFYSCSCIANSVTGMKNLSHYPLHNHTVSSSRDGFIQRFG